MASFDDLDLTDTAWMRRFAWLAAELDDNATGQLELLPVDDWLEDKRYVPCPRRGTHQRLVDCWMCWCDVAYGYATASEVIAAGDDPAPAAGC